MKCSTKWRESRGPIARPDDPLQGAARRVDQRLILRFQKCYFWLGNSYEVPWTNGAVAVASKITFNNSFVSNEGLFLTGSLSIAKANGSC